MIFLKTSNKFSFRYLVTTIFSLILCASSYAQGYTSQVQSRGNKGTVIIKQDEEITKLVDGKSYIAKSANDITQTADKLKNQTLKQDTSITTLKRGTFSSRGYRIQVYSGDDSRNARQTARQMAGQLKALFPELPVYTRFFSPHWTCRAGDFRTHEEANQYFQEVRKTGIFKAATIIKCNIQVSY